MLGRRIEGVADGPAEVDMMHPYVDARTAFPEFSQAPQRVRASRRWKGLRIRGSTGAPKRGWYAIA
jgi:hypothetical protein